MAESAARADGSLGGGIRGLPVPSINESASASHLTLCLLTPSPKGWLGGMVTVTGIQEEILTWEQSMVVFKNTTLIM